MVKLHLQTCILSKIYIVIQVKFEDSILKFEWVWMFNF